MFCHDRVGLTGKGKYVMQEPPREFFWFLEAYSTDTIWKDPWNSQVISMLKNPQTNKKKPEKVSGGAGLVCLLTYPNSEKEDPRTPEQSYFNH